MKTTSKISNSTLSNIRVFCFHLLCCLLSLQNVLAWTYLPRSWILLSLMSFFFFFFPLITSFSCKDLICLTFIIFLLCSCGSVITGCLRAHLAINQVALIEQKLVQKPSHWSDHFASFGKFFSSETAHKLVAYAKSQDYFGNSQSPFWLQAKWCLQPG